MCYTCICCWNSCTSLQWRHMRTLTSQDVGKLAAYSMACSCGQQRKLEISASAITDPLWGESVGHPWMFSPLQWRHNGHNGVSNHQPHHCLRKQLFRRRSKKMSKLRVTGLCVGNSPVTGEFPAQKASNAENVSIWWRYHDKGQVMWKRFQATTSSCVRDTTVKPPI